MQNFVQKFLFLLLLVNGNLAFASDLVTKKLSEIHTNITEGPDSYVIPEQIPFVSGTLALDVFVTYDRSDIRQGRLDVDFGLTPECFGENGCSLASFLNEKVDGRLYSLIDLIVHEKYEIVGLQNNTEGYFIPSKCSAYCRKSTLFWFGKGHVYAISTKDNYDISKTKQELIESANSLILRLNK